MLNAKKALLLSIILILALLTSCNAPPATHSSSSISQVPFATAKSGSASSPTTPSQEQTWRWVKEPYAEYEQMIPPTDHYSSGTLYKRFINVQQDGKWGTIDFDGNIVFEPDADDPLSVCGDEHTHYSVPWLDELYFSDPAEFERTLSAIGLPTGYAGGHGGDGGYIILAHPESDAKALFGSGVGVTLSMEPGRFANQPPVLPFTVEVSGYAPDFSNYWELYEEISTAKNASPSYGMMSTEDFSVLLPQEYDTFNDVVSGYYTLLKGNLWGYFSVNERKLITECIYEIPWSNDAVNYSHNAPLGFFNEGLCTVKRDGLYGFINEQGKEMVPPQFEGATHVYNGRAWVKQNGLWGIIEINAAFLGNWFCLSGEKFDELLLNEDGSIVLAVGSTSAGYDTFSGTYTIENGLVNYKVISDNDLAVAQGAEELSSSAATANARQFTGSFQLTVVDDTHIQLIGVYLSEQVDLLLEKGSFLESIGIVS